MNFKEFVILSKKIVIAMLAFFLVYFSNDTVNNVETPLLLIVTVLMLELQAPVNEEFYRKGKKASYRNSFNNKLYRKYQMLTDGRYCQKTYNAIFFRK